MEKIIILGGKGTAVSLAEQIYDSQCKTGDVEFLGFAFDDPNFGSEINGFPILGNTFNIYEKYEKYEDVKFIFQLYRTDIIKERIALRDSFNIPIERFATFIHPSAYVAKSATLGPGTSAFANVTINNNVVIGCHNTIQSGILIEHDSTLGNSNFLAGGSAIGSGVVIGDGNFIGLQTALNNHITVGDYNFIGMGSNVIKSVECNKLIYGNPAKCVTGEFKPL